MKSSIVFLLAAALLGTTAGPSFSSDRYRERPPVVVSPDLSAPWVIQLSRKPARSGLRRQGEYGVRVQPGLQEQRRFTREERRAMRRLERPQAQEFSPDRVRTAAVRVPRKREIEPQLDPKFLPQEVAYSGGEKAGTIVIDGRSKFLYLVQGDGTARRYGVGVGKEGFEWSGTEKITQKREWPDWRPPAEMIARERAKGRVLPVHMPGGPANPLGARALYLGNTLYRIHGTNAPWTIGTNVSSGCIRMRNEDVIDLYERVGTGTRVVVL
jgi:lipoprotein-anchoring transpeptidase ErfK/SrfK